MGGDGGIRREPPVPAGERRGDCAASPRNAKRNDGSSCAEYCVSVVRKHFESMQTQGVVSDKANRMPSVAGYRGAAASVPHFVIRARKKWQIFDWREFVE